ncbi:MAG TPA: lipopolysaccharide assembly protein LapA domain-containing protein [Candidatus Polarisedimenticolaceae bacterium]|nr:lipopolysaccharide assembly protein LapA domain-containing protein [Candidatus Polarisedimenticolaceae bacterium]
MRLLLYLLLILMAVALLGFAVTNLNTTVRVVVWNTEYPAVPLPTVAAVAVLAGAIFAALIGVLESAALRLAQRRLRREVQRLERALIELRTQPRAPQPEPDSLSGIEPGAMAVPAGRAIPEGPASAPVYGDPDEWTDPDDETYSGGRAV